MVVFVLTTTSFAAATCIRTYMRTYTGAVHSYAIHTLLMSLAHSPSNYCLQLQTHTH